MHPGKSSVRSRGQPIVIGGWSLVLWPIQVVHPHPSTVMPGLDPGIHGTGTVARLSVDGRVKPGHDDSGKSCV